MGKVPYPPNASPYVVADELACENLEGQRHNSHLYFSRVSHTDLSWLLSTWFRWRSLVAVWKLHCSHLNGFSFVWVWIWILSLGILEKVFGHKRHCCCFTRPDLPAKENFEVPFSIFTQINVNFNFWFALTTGKKFYTGWLKFFHSLRLCQTSMNQNWNVLQARVTQTDTALDKTADHLI